MDITTAVSPISVKAEEVFMDSKTLVLFPVGGTRTVPLAVGESLFIAAVFASSIRGCGGRISVTFVSVGNTVGLPLVGSVGSMVGSRVGIHVGMRVGPTDGLSLGGILVGACEGGGIIGNSPLTSQYPSVRVRLQTFPVIQGPSSLILAYTPG